MPQVSVIVPARNAQQTLRRTLDALAEQDLDADYEVIVVDDGSTDRTAEIARGAGARVRLVTQAPAGPGMARNAGVAQSSASALAFCDADVVPTRGWLRAGLEALARADLVQGRVLPDPGASLGPFDRTIWITSEVGLWEAANLFMTREVFDRACGFGDGIVPRAGKPLGEDLGLGYRAIRDGARTVFCPDALAHHAVFERGWLRYVGERSRLRHFPALIRSAPELRERFFYRRVFLDRRSATFDLALAGVAAAIRLRSPWPLLAVAPYMRAARSHAHRARASGEGPGSGAVAAADLAADLVGLTAMIGGSARYRSLLL